MEEIFKRYELLCKDVKHQIDFVDDYYEFNFKHLEETLNEMKSFNKKSSFFDVLSKNVQFRPGRIQTIHTYL